MAILRVAVVALVLATMCSCVSDVGQKEQSSADDVLALRARLTEGEWRLFSWVYPALPTGGYPIEFEASGRVQTENLASTETWQLTEDLTLQLASKARVPRMSLSYDSEAGVFVSQPEAGSAFVVGPVGFGFAEYLQNLVDDFTPSSIPSGASAALQDATTTEHELDTILSKAKNRIHIDPTWAWAPERNDQDRFPYFEKHNESRWNLELDPSKIEPGTIYEQTVHTEEGGVVSEYLVFDKGKVTWWFDGRGDQYSEFESPSVRKKNVMKLFLAIHDGKSGWAPIDKSKEMPLDHGLSVGIILVDGSQRFW